MATSISEKDQEAVPRPPIMSRMATFFADLSEEFFEQYYPEWQQKIVENLPEEHREPQWRFELEGYENGLPKLKSTQPSMLINAWNVKELPDDRGTNTARVFPNEGKGKGGVSFTVGRVSTEHSRSYEELRHFFANTLPEFETSFQCQNYTAVELHYQNLIRSDLYPEFDPDGGAAIDLGFVLETHKNLELPGYGFLLPYKHEMNCKASDDPEVRRFARVRIEITEPLVDEKGNTDQRVNLLVDFKIMQICADGASQRDALAAMDDCHEKMLEFFRKTFTAKAQKVFSCGTFSATT